MPSKKKSRKKHSLRNFSIVGALGALGVIFAEYVSFQYLAALQTYLFTQGNLRLENLVLLFPIGIAIAFAFFVIALVRAFRSESQLPSLRRFFNRVRIARWIEFPLSMIFLLFTAPGAYGIWTVVSLPCASSPYIVYACFWPLGSVEFVILIHIFLILGIFLFVDSVWQIFVVERKEEPSNESVSDSKDSQVFSGGIELDPRFSQAEARLFFPWYYFLPIGPERDLNHIPRDKLMLAKKTRKAYWIGDYAMNLLVPVQKVDWISERKPLFHLNLKKWAEDRGWIPMEQTATEADLT